MLDNFASILNSIRYIASKLIKTNHFIMSESIIHFLLYFSE